MTGPGFGVAMLVLLSLTAQAAAGKGEKQPQIGHTTAQQAMHKKTFEEKADARVEAKLSTFK